MKALQGKSAGAVELSRASNVLQAGTELTIMAINSYCSAEACDETLKKLSRRRADRVMRPNQNCAWLNQEA